MQQQFLFRAPVWHPAHAQRRKYPLPKAVAGTLTFVDIVNNANAPQVSTTGVAQVFDSTGVTLIVAKAFSTDGSGNAVVSDVLLVPATVYSGLLTMADGKRGAFSLTAT